MNNAHLKVCLLGGLLSALMALASPSAIAHDRTPAVNVGTLKIEKVWARATPASAKAGVGYVMITNLGREPDRLVGARTPIADGAQLHVTRETDGSIEMQPLETGIEITPGSRAVLRPGAGQPHIMFVGLNGPIKAGKPFKVTLEFEKAGPVEVKFRTVAIGASPAHAGH